MDLALLLWRSFYELGTINDYTFVTMLVILLCLCYVGYIFWSKVMKIPEDAPPRLSYIDSMKIYMQNTDTWGKFLRIADLNRESNGVGYGNVGLYTLYVISDPEDTLTVLKSCSEKAFLYDFWKPWLGEGLFTGKVHINKQHRKYFLPMVSPRKLDSFIKDFDENANRFVSKMAPRVGEQPFDILRDLLIYNLELLCVTLLGLPDIHENYDFNPYCDSVGKFLRIAIDRFEKLPYHIDAIYNYTKMKKEQDKLLKKMHSTSFDLIERRRVLYIKEKQKKGDTEEPAKDVYTDVLLEAVDQGLLTETEMREEMDTILFGGHDTTAFTLLYALVLLGSYPEVQEKVYQEVEDILGKNKDVTKGDLSKMVYLESCIKESQRLYPYGAILGRRLDKDIKLKTCTLRAGSTAMMLVWEAHRHSSWGPDALQYRPERWMEPDTLPCPAPLLCFSEGSRACTGRKYAMLSMKTLLARFIREYRIKADHTKLQFEMLGVLECKSGHEVTLERRA